jgi:hypothetical protein
VANKNQLIVEVVLEPEHDLLMVTPALHSRVVFGAASRDLRLVPISTTGEVLHPHPAPFVGGDPGWRRALVQYIRPRDKLPGNARALEAFPRGVAVEDV